MSTRVLSSLAGKMTSPGNLTLETRNLAANTLHCVRRMFAVLTAFSRDSFRGLLRGKINIKGTMGMAFSLASLKSQADDLVIFRAKERSPTRSGKAKDLDT